MPKKDLDFYLDEEFSFARVRELFDEGCAEDFFDLLNEADNRIRQSKKNFKHAAARIGELEKENARVVETISAKLNELQNLVGPPVYKIGPPTNLDKKNLEELTRQYLYSGLKKAEGDVFAAHFCQKSSPPEDSIMRYGELFFYRKFGANRNLLQMKLITKYEYANKVAQGFKLDHALETGHESQVWKQLANMAELNPLSEYNLKDGQHHYNGHNEKIAALRAKYGDDWVQHAHEEFSAEAKPILKIENQSQADARGLGDIYRNFYAEASPRAIKITAGSKCECGSSASSLPTHSTWCPVNKGG